MTAIIKGIDDNRVIESILYDSESSTIKVIRRTKSGAMFSCYPPRPVPDHIERITYGIVGGKLVETLIESATIIPATEETFKFK